MGEKPIGCAGEPRDAIRVARSKMGRVFAAVVPPEGEGQGLEEKLRRLAELLFELADAVLGVIERVDVEELEPGEFVGHHVGAPGQLLERLGDVVLRELVVSIGFGVVGRGFEEEPDQLGGRDLREFHVNDMEGGSRPIDREQFVDRAVHVGVAFPVEAAGKDLPPIKLPLVLRQEVDEPPDDAAKGRADQQTDNPRRADSSFETRLDGAGEDAVQGLGVQPAQHPVEAAVERPRRILGENFPDKFLGTGLGPMSMPCARRPAATDNRSEPPARERT